MRFQDIQLKDKELWGQFQAMYQAGDYSSALAFLQNTQLSGKGLTAEILNALTEYIVQIQNTSDPSFKQNKIPCQAEQPTQQNINEIWLEITG